MVSTCKWKKIMLGASAEQTWRSFKTWRICQVSPSISPTWVLFLLFHSTLVKSSKRQRVGCELVTCSKPFHMSAPQDGTKPVNHPARPVWWRSAAHQSHHTWEIISRGGFEIWTGVREILPGLPAAPLLLAGFRGFKAAHHINALLAALVPELCEYFL